MAAWEVERAKYDLGLHSHVQHVPRGLHIAWLHEDHHAEGATRASAAVCGNDVDVSLCESIQYRVSCADVIVALHDEALLHPGDREPGAPDVGEEGRGMLRHDRELSPHAAAREGCEGEQVHACALQLAEQPGALAGLVVQPEVEVVDPPDCHGHREN